MNALMCDNIREVALLQYKQIEQQIMQPDTTKEECEILIKAQKSVSDTIRYLLQAIGLNVVQGMSRRQV